MEDKKSLAASQDEGSKSVVGVLFLGLNTLQAPVRGVVTVGEFDLTSKPDAALPVPPPETVMSFGLSGVLGVEGESCTGGKSSLGIYHNLATKARLERGWSCSWRLPVTPATPRFKQIIG